MTPLPTASRTRRVPPPLLAPLSALEGLEILDEIPGDAGFLLMASLRSLTLWTQVEPGERPGLYMEGALQNRLHELRGAELPDGVRAPLTVLAGVLDAPEEADGSSLAGACHAIAAWAQECACPATAYLFLQAAARAEPGSPGLALRVGRAACARGDADTAESWLHHAVVLARAREDWDSYALGYLAIGDLHLHRGDAMAARRATRKALRATERHRLEGTHGMAHHGMAGLAFELNEPAAATLHGRAALHAYGAGHPRLPLLAHDLAYVWLSGGHPGAALRVLEAMRPLLIGRSLDWLYLVANTARAAAGCGRRDTFAAARAECLEVCRMMGEPAGASSALLEVARGAAEMGDEEGARALAARAATLAIRHREEEVRASASALLTGREVRAGDTVDTDATPREVERLARELSLALERCAPLVRN